MALITRGDDASITLDLAVDGAAVNASTSSISAALQNQFGQAVISATAQSSSAVGAAWATGVVVVEFSPEQTASLSPGIGYRLEVQETLSTGKKRTYPLIDVEVQQGTIP
jgi:hypothetical protein